MKQRLNYIDSLRAFAAYFVFILHFITWSASWYMEDFVALIAPFKGLNGSFGVLLFGVLLGYFARKSKTGAEEYILKRFLQFTIIPFVIYLFIYSFFVFFERVLGGTATISIFTQFYGKYFVDLLNDMINYSLWVKTDTFYRVLWTLEPFFVASVAICVLRGLLRGKNKWLEMGIITALVVLFILVKSNDDWNTNLWVSFCFMGYLVSCVEDLKLAIFTNRKSCYLVLACSFIAVAECGNFYSGLAWQGVAFSVFFLALRGAPKVQKCLSFPPLVALGKISFHVYMWHFCGIYVTMEMMRYFGYDPTAKGVQVWVSLGLSALLTLLMSTASYFLYDVWFAQKVLNPLFAKKDSAAVKTQP